MATGIQPRSKTARLDKRVWVLLAFTAPVALLASNGVFNGPLYRMSVIGFWLMDFTGFVIVPATSLYLLYRIAGVRPRDYGFRGPSVALSGAGIVSLSVVMTLLAYMVLVVFSTPSFATFTYHDVVPGQPLLALVAATYLSLTAAFTEETIFRALPWLYLKMLFPKKRLATLYVITTSIVFGLGHIEHGVPYFMCITIFGLLMAFMYTKVENIWPFVFAHFAVDFWIFS